jgi:transposase
VCGGDRCRETGACGLRARGTQWRRPSQAQPYRGHGGRLCAPARLRAWLETWGAAERLLIGLEAAGPLWERLYEHLTQAGYVVLLLNPRPTASWASSLGLRAKTDGIDAQTLARGLLAGLARASTVPSETVQALRTLTRARRDRMQSRTATRQRLHDELVTLFPEFVRFLATLPGRADLGDPPVLQLLHT